MIVEAFIKAAARLIIATTTRTTGHEETPMYSTSLRYPESPQTRGAHSLAAAVFVTIILVGLSLAARAGEGTATGDPDHPTATAGNPLWADGFQSGQIFENINGTAVNTFNFNFVMGFSTGMGFAYPENGGLNLQPTRYYNSQVGKWVYVSCHWREFYRIRRENPMGLGWDFNFGRIIRVHNSDRHAFCGEVLPGDTTRTQYPWAYVSPDGARHTLELFDAATREYRSHDGSYVRAIQQLDGSGAMTGWKVELPNGTVFEMDHLVGDPLDAEEQFWPYPPFVPWKEDFSRVEQFSADPQGCDFDCGGSPCTTQNQRFVPDDDLTSSLRDRDWVGWFTTRVYTKAEDSASGSPNSYTIAYQTEANREYIPMTITDRHNRSISVTINTDGLIDTITVPGPAAAVGGTGAGVYNFEYGPKETIDIPLVSDTHDV